MKMLHINRIKSNNGWICPPQYWRETSINPAWDDEKIIKLVTKLIKDYGYDTMDMSVERKGSDIILRWVWCFVCSEDLYCSCLLDDEVY